MRPAISRIAGSAALHRCEAGDSRWRDRHGRPAGRVEIRVDSAAYSHAGCERDREDGAEESGASVCVRSPVAGWPGSAEGTADRTQAVVAKDRQAISVAARLG